MRLIASALLACSLAGSASAADLITFWDKPQHGGNSFNRLPPDDAYFRALAGYGATWVRLSYDKWEPAKRDYLIGDADKYEGIPAADLKTLKETLDRADKAGLKVVIAPLSLPGMRWAQNNGNRFDGRLWQDKIWWGQAAAFWQDLARALKDHPAVAAYNIVNEPAPEKRNGLAEHADRKTMQAWYGDQAGSASDLRAFYETVIAAIRAVDPATPIMADAGWYAAADAFSYWPAALTDQKVLYSFHMYEPYAATSAPNMKRDKPYVYPGKVPFGDGEETWDRARVDAYLAEPVRWAKDKGVPLNRLVAGEFGCMRLWSGCKTYLEDVLTALHKDDLHWAFYSFREDAWDGMDYELGAKKVGWKYWQQMEANERDTTPRKATPEFEPISRRLQGTD
ncbi:MULTISPECIES: glycoside hydrolase family 5 protein [unclassified Ensifer]|uniref:glycoside hydrolase family 5 protein n=1 Tax=unclassified Ensifer TaxID=2633371 RepID=UPI00088F4864|nr:MULTISPECIES: cellulase family glycosylhydrolase [unclassified Ensifer]MBD9597225.1 cellulase family glycosylhydrolase [Ensifer sp. ENS05]MBD9624156.1 cellulase family glycosylhydrolase [Ensifer sp. ENS06]SDM54650.1 Cellulase (glycosyl hydrolase family 5) [Ensifer sp. YR511]